MIRRAVELLYQAQRYDEADQLLGKLREQTPLTGDLRRLSEDLTLRTHGPVPAIDSARKAVAAGSRDCRDYLWLAQLLSTAGKEAEVEPLLRQAVALADGSPTPGSRSVAHLTRRKRTEQAEATVREAESALSKVKLPLALARCYELIGRKEQAQDLYRAALAEKPNDPSTLREIARFNLQNGQLQDAEGQLRALITLKTVAPAEASWATWSLALLLSQGGDYPRCQQALGSSTASMGTSSRGAPSASIADKRVRATVLARERGRPHRQEAIRLLEEVTGQTTTQAQDEFLLAQLYDEAGKWTQAQQHLLSLVNPDSPNPEYFAYYARSLLRQGDQNGASFMLAKLQKADPADPGRWKSRPVSCKPRTKGRRPRS